MSERIFISHASRDAEIANQIQQFLESNDRKAWIAPRDVPAGSNYPSAIVGAIRDCAYGVLVLTDSSNDNQNVLREVELLASEKKQLFVICVDPVTLSDDLAYFANVIHRISAPRERFFEDHTALLHPILRFEKEETPSVQEPETRVGMQPLVPEVAAAPNLSELVDTHRKILSILGVAVLDYICQQPDPSQPISRKELLGRLQQATPGVFDGLAPRQFESLLTDARNGGCAPGLCENHEGVFVEEENIATKRERNCLGKSLVAQYAASLVDSGSVVALDGGSTTLPIVENLLASVDLGDIEDLTIVTNSLPIAQLVGEFTASQGWTDDTAMVALYFVGGFVRPNTHATTWGTAGERERKELLEDLAQGPGNINFGFVGGNGFDLEHGITMGASAELEFKRFILESSQKPYIVADSSKSGIMLPVKIAAWEDDFTLITNVIPDDALTELEELVLTGKIVEVRE